MNKKASYYPVSDHLSKPAEKHLAQGSPAFSSSSSTVKGSNLSWQQSSKSSFNEPDDIQKGKKSNVKSKVICHSPQVVLSNIANSGSTKVERIPIDVPPTIHITSEDKSVNLSHGNYVASSYNTSNIAGSPLDLSSTAKVIHTSHESFDQTPYPETSVNTAQAYRQIKKSPVKGLSKEVPVSEMKNKLVKKRKKPAVKVVESRYNTTGVKKTAGQSFDRTMSQKSKLSTSSYKARSSKPPAAIKLHHGDATPKTKTRKEILMEKASTPSAGFKTFFESDVSHIASDKHKDDVVAPTKEVRANVDSDHEEFTQTKLDILYSDCLRVAYLCGAMKQAHEEKTKKALADLSLLCTGNVQLQKEVADLEEEVFTLQHLEELESHLDTQITALGPAVNKLSVTTGKYKELAINVDATRHALPLNGVVVPDEKQLESVLKRSNEICGELTTLTHTHVDGCLEAAEKSRKLGETITDLSSTLDDVEILSKTVTSLAVKETSLKLQLESEMSSIDPLS